MLHELRRTGANSEGPSEENMIAIMNHDLHGTILEYAGNGNLKLMVVSLIESIHRYLNLIHFKIELEAEKSEHETIVAALLEKNTEKAVNAMRAHLNNAYHRLRDNFNL